MKVLTVAGTRPEAVKLAPVILELAKYPDQIDSLVCVTAQHRGMLDQVFRLFEITPDIDLDLMQPGQTLPGLTSRVIVEMDRVLAQEQPDVVLVQGDTTTVMATALSAFYRQIPVGHVEAGLRSHDRYSPFPEEINRKIAGVLANYHFAPTTTAQRALLNEGVDPNDIYLTGNTVIDALQMIVSYPQPEDAAEIIRRATAAAGINRRIVLVTAHRRENFGERLEAICAALKALVAKHPELVLVYPVHLNPRVRETVFQSLDGIKRILLTDPLDYDAMAHVMSASYLVLTDSGGLQEEAPALGKPVLVLRTETERPEAIEAGTAKLVGPNTERIIAETERLLSDAEGYNQMAQATSPYGDGHAAERIVQILLSIPPMSYSPPR